MFPIFSEYPHTSRTVWSSNIETTKESEEIKMPESTKPRLGVLSKVEILEQELSLLSKSIFDLWNILEPLLSEEMYSSKIYANPAKADSHGPDDSKEDVIKKIANLKLGLENSRHVIDYIANELTTK